jgi:meso-butanediol dehydrogenase/(S,S)-butanediol dehydrogenase/diacetyl reductase
MKRFEGKVALVTGAASGIGLATAERLAAEGASVVCVDVNESGAAAAADKIRAAGGEATATACDVSDEGSVTSTVHATVARYGGLHVLANVAGIGGFKRTLDLTLADWNRFLAVNLTGPFLMCQKALPHLLKVKGSIVNTGSVAGIKSHPYAAGYCASKGGVVMLTKALAVEYARKGVRVNCVCPGGVETPLLQQFQLPPGGSPQQLVRISPLMDRMATPGEVASAIAYLSSDEASYINGSILVVDGAMTA